MLRNVTIEALAGLSFFRLAASAALFLRAGVRLAGRRFYDGMNDLCQISRICPSRRLRRSAQLAVGRLLSSRSGFDGWRLRESFLLSNSAVKLATMYALDGAGSNDLFRDVIVLKAAIDGEKGVIVLKYTRTFDAVVALFDLEQLMERFTFVLEPSWAGYCDPSILMFACGAQPVLVQCFTDNDYEYIEGLRCGLIPVRMGPADWVDEDLFGGTDSTSARDFDLVMVANWGIHKRHATLFRALGSVRQRPLKVLLIGYPWGGRTADDIRREARETAPPDVQLQFVESIPQEQVAQYLRRCSALVFLSKKEGDNKAVVEAMFADVPVIVYSDSVGGATYRVNSATGILVSDDELGAGISSVLSNRQSFSPRQWASANTGARATTTRLNEALRQVTTAYGGRYSVPIVEKTNSPNLSYRPSHAREDFAADYEYLLSCRRPKQG